MRRGLQCTAFVLLSALSGARAGVFEGRVIAHEGPSWTFEIGGVRTALTEARRVRRWRNRAEAGTAAFAVGETVSVRVSGGEPAEVREIADPVSALWLAEIRRGWKAGEVTARGSNELTLRFEDGTSFRYRIVPSTRVFLGGRPAGVADLKTGARLWVRGRLLSSLDTAAREVSDAAPVAAPTPSNSRRTAPLPTLAARGTVEADVFLVVWGTNLFQIWVGERLHNVHWTPLTRFRAEGRACGPDELEPGVPVRVAYRRDRFGRIVATRVDVL